MVVNSMENRLDTIHQSKTYDLLLNIGLSAADHPNEGRQYGSRNQEDQLVVRCHIKELRGQLTSHTERTEVIVV